MFKLLKMLKKKVSNLGLLAVKGVNVEIHGYHYSKCMRTMSDMHVGFEFEFVGNGYNPFPAYYLRDIATPEHDGSVAVEYPTKPIPVSNVAKIRRLLYSVQAALEMADKYKRHQDAVTISGSAGTHLHLSVTSGAARSRIDKNCLYGSAVLRYLLKVQEGIEDNKLSKLFGRGFGSYRQKFVWTSHANMTDTCTLRAMDRYKWVNFQNKVTIEYRLPRFKNAKQYFWAFRGCMRIHKDIMRILRKRECPTKRTVDNWAKRCVTDLIKYKKIVERGLV